MPQIIDEMPTFAQVQAAGARQIVRWQLLLRPTMSNDELDVVKAIARRYDALPANTRELLAAEVRRQL